MAAIAGLAIIIGIVGFSGQLIINDVSEGGIIQMSEHGSTGVKPLIIDLEELDISYVDDKFATLFYDDKYNLSDYNEDASTITNLEAVNSFITFDIFICNSDRHRRNTMLIPNSKGSGSYYKYVLIDHGRCFNIVDGDLPYIDTQIHWNTSEVNSKRLRKRSEYMIGRVTSSLVKRILTKISRYATHQNDVGVLQNVLINRGAGDIMQIIDKHHRHLLGGQ